MTMDERNHPMSHLLNAPKKRAGKSQKGNGLRDGLGIERDACLAMTLVHRRPIERLSGFRSLRLSPSGRRRACSNFAPTPLGETAGLAAPPLAPPSLPSATASGFFPWLGSASREPSSCSPMACSTTRRATHYQLLAPTAHPNRRSNGVIRYHLRTCRSLKPTLARS